MSSARIELTTMLITSLGFSAANACAAAPSVNARSVVLIKPADILFNVLFVRDKNTEKNRNAFRKCSAASKKRFEMAPLFGEICRPADGVDSLDVPSAECSEGLASGVQRAVRCRVHYLPDLLHLSDCFGRHGGGREFFAYVCQRLGRRVYKVIGIEPVVAQVVVQYLVCREVVGRRISVDYLCGCEFERSLAQEVFIGAVTEVAGQGLP